MTDFINCKRPSALEIYDEKFAKDDLFVYQHTLSYCMLG